MLTCNFDFCSMKLLELMLLPIASDLFHCWSLPSIPCGGVVSSWLVRLSQDCADGPDFHLACHSVRLPQQLLSTLLLVGGVLLIKPPRLPHQKYRLMIIKLTLSGMSQYKHLSSLPGLRRAGSIKSGRLVAART